ncbi:hypothetical protein ACH4E5_10780 [Streptomyces afghaniensis]|uniref:hypothetical protein n=1 Tax=Streptomyces afghaniensis TaxID=66865 RepID=UPI0037A6206E
MISRMRRRTPRLREGYFAKKAVERFSSDVLYLHPGRRPTRRLRVALRRYEWADSIGLPAIRLAAAFVSYAVGIAGATSVTTAVREETDKRLAILRSEFERSGSDLAAFLKEYPLRPLELVAPYLSVLLLTYMLCVLICALLHTVFGGRLSISKKTRVRNRYLLVDRARKVVRACARAKRHPDGKRAATAKRSVGVALNALAREVAVAYRREGAVAFRWSHRRQALKGHAGKVVAALREAEMELDTDLRKAVSEISDLALTVAERYSQGMVGALLDEERLAGLEPVTDREPYRIAGIALLVGASGAAIAFLDLPATAETYLIGGVGLALATLLYRGGSTRAMEIVEVVRGGQQ